MSRRPVRYAEKIDRNKKRARIIINIAVLVVLCALLRSFVVQTLRVENDAMSPGLHKGDIVLAVPYVLRLRGVPQGLAGAMKSGNVVLVSDGAEFIVPPRQRLMDATIRFLTFQRFSILRNEYGDSFSVPTLLRVHSMKATAAKGSGSLTISLSCDQQQSGTRAAKLRVITASQIKGRAIFRIWPLSAIGPVR